MDATRAKPRNSIPDSSDTSGTSETFTIEYDTISSYLITGVTGYVGQAVLLEFLRSQNPPKITVLIREKYGLTPQERLDRIAKSFPDLDFSDIQVIDRSMETLEAIQAKFFTHVIHSAAVVNFGKIAIAANVVPFAKFLKVINHPGLEQFVYISTAYVLPCEDGHQNLIKWNSLDLKPGKEEEYLKFCQNTDFVPEFDDIGKLHNSYFLSKILAEHILDNFTFAGSVQKMILRSSIVTPALEYPRPMWFKGSAGLIGACKGYRRKLYKLSFHLDGISGHLNLIPSDVLAKMIVYESSLPREPDPGLVIRNLCVPLSSCINSHFIMAALTGVAGGKLRNTNNMSLAPKIILRGYERCRVFVLSKMARIPVIHVIDDLDLFVNNTWEFEISEEMRRVGDFHIGVYIGKLQQFFSKW
jgi:nucleoside-diphosphate-sugar epimerase